MNRNKIILVILSLFFASLACLSASDEIPVVDSSGAQEDSGEVPENPEDVQTTDVPDQSDEIISLEGPNVNWYSDSIDVFRFLGIVENTGNINLEFVEIIVSLRDDTGTLIASESTFIELDVLPAGQSSPFSVFFMNNPGEWSEYEVLAQGDEAGFLESYTDFEIISSNGSIPGFGDYEIVGEILNTGDQDAEFVQIIVVLYDAEGNILAVDFTFAALDIVRAGNTSPFSLTIFGKADGEIAKYDLYIEGNPIN